MYLSIYLLHTIYLLQIIYLYIVIKYLCSTYYLSIYIYLCIYLVIDRIILYIYLSFPRSLFPPHPVFFLHPPARPGKDGNHKAHITMYPFHYLEYQSDESIGEGLNVASSPRYTVIAPSPGAENYRSAKLVTCVCQCNRCLHRAYRNLCIIQRLIVGK